MMKHRTLTIAMEACQASRPGTITSDTSILRMLFAGLPEEKLVKRGTVQVDGQQYTLYLPKAQSSVVLHTKHQAGRQGLREHQHAHFCRSHRRRPADG